MTTFAKHGNDVIYDVIIWVQDGNCTKWLERILGGVVNFTTVACRISSRLKWYKNYKNQLRLAKVIVKNTLPRFFLVLCVYIYIYIHNLPVQYMAKHRAKFGWPQVSDVAAVTKPRSRKPLKFPGMPQTNETISAASGPKFAILWGHVKEVLLFNKFFSDCRYVP